MMTPTAAPSWVTFHPDHPNAQATEARGNDV